MSTAKKNILILSFFFPPCNKVGGRRWAKFAKYLYRRGYNIDVVCVDYPYYVTCPWEQDVAGIRPHIRRIPYIEHRRFYLVFKSPKKLFDKVRYRFSWYLEKLFPARLTEDPIDISDQYHNALVRTADRIVREKNINTVVITGGPFRWCHEGMQLKKIHPQVRFILDLRDFWTGGPSYNKFTDDRKQQEDDREMECINLADVVLTPAERIADYLRQRYPANKSKIFDLPHAYDSEEIGGAMVTDPDNDRISLVYGGILYSHMEKSIERLIFFISGMISRGFRVTLDLFTFDTAYSEVFARAGLNVSVKYHQPVPPRKLFEIMGASDFVLQLRAGEANEQHFKSTKFYELIALRRPILYFGPEGDIENFIIAHHLGLSGNLPIDELCEKVELHKKYARFVPKWLDVSAYEYEKVTTELEKYL